MLAFHVVIVVLSKKVGVKSSGNILGIFTSAIGGVPLVGMEMYILTAIYTMMYAAKRATRRESNLIGIE